MKKLLAAIICVLICWHAQGQGSFATAEYMGQNVVKTGTVTDNNNGPVNIPFHYYKTSLAGNGIIRIISTVTNTNASSAGDVFIKIYFKDQVLWDTRQVTVGANTTLTDTFLVTGVQKDSIYILFQNYGVVYGGPFNYTTSYDLLDVAPNTEVEPNDFHTQAQTLVPGDSINGHISFRATEYYRDYYDYYKLVLPDNGTADLYFSFTNLRIASTFTIPGPTVYGRGKDSSIFVQLAHTSSGHSDNLTIANNTNTPLGLPVFDTMHIYGRAKDTIYIHMFNYFTGWDVGYSGSYTLKYQMSDIAPSNETNPNEDLAHAQFITDADNIQGIIGYYDGKNNVDQNDYFKIATPPGDSIKLYITAINKFKYESLSVNPSVFGYDKNGNAITVYSATGASTGGGQLIRNVWMQPFDVPISDTMTLRNIPTDSIYIRIYNYDAAFTYQLRYGSSVTTAINDLDKEGSLAIYPNPASDEINISLITNKEEEVELCLYALTGARVATFYNGKISGRYQLTRHLGELADGMYFLQMKTKSAAPVIRKIAVRR